MEMNQHLSADQISGWTSGERNLEVEQHIAACPACRTQVAALQDTLAAFRGSLHQWSEEQFRTSAPIRPQAVKPLSWVTWNKLSGACVAVMICLVAGVSVRQRTNQESAAEAATTDALLLKQVDMELSRTVPRPMEPLTKLMVWDAVAAAESSDSEKTRNKFGNQ
jgi:anti-sigma factor RsiW